MNKKSGQESIAAVMGRTRKHGRCREVAVMGRLSSRGFE